MKNIDTAFRAVRMLSFVTVIGSFLFSSYVTYKSYSKTTQDRERVWVLINGKALEAYASNTRDNLEVEAKAHITNFHELFFGLSPDEKQIENSTNKALYLADESAKKIYDDLKEKNYYSNIISGNVEQTIVIDSIQLDLNSEPYPFICYGTQTLTRPTTTVTRNLISSGRLRKIRRSPHNTHGFLIERWTIQENSDIQIKNR